MTEINSKFDLLDALKDSNERAEIWFRAIPADVFFTRQGEVWSPSDNVDHLIKSVKPVTRALKLPKTTLHEMFGKPEKSSMTYDQICEIYRDALANGGQASGRYLPNQETPTDSADEKKTALIDQWAEANAELLSVLEGWNEHDLDLYQLSHPLIGNLTVREMIFFTIYHNLRHASLEGD